MQEQQRVISLNKGGGDEGRRKRPVLIWMEAGGLFKEGRGEHAILLFRQESYKSSSEKIRVGGGRGKSRDVGREAEI